MSAIPEQMNAIVQDVYGGPEVLHFATVPTPTAGPRDLLVRVRAISVNPVDMKVRDGGPAGTPVPGVPKILGWDGAGVVAATGPEVTRFRPGDEVYFAGDITRPGSYAQFVAIDERIVGRKPRRLTLEEAAAMPLTTLTAWEALFETFRIDPLARPRSILIVGGAGGVGSVAVQIARRVAGLTVVATASRPESATYARHMGAGAVIDHGRELQPQARELGFAGFDYIFSTASLSNFPQLVSVLNPLGHICVIVSGPDARALDVSGLMPIRGTLSYELMFTRPRLGVEPERQGEILDRVADLLDSGVLVTTMKESLSWREIQVAHNRLAAGHTIGKIVLNVD
ncbi:MAG: zinc-binding alcohol dehydrogenase family protein [Caldilineaceae bacterium]|nr:zinc-binding alcohol dehydrogenase family protein [Caldilineaceae bacterium]